MKYTLDQKLTILLDALNERYKSIHEIRARVQSICIWLLGILAVATGWLIQSGVNLSFEQRFLYSGIILIIVAYLRFFYFRDLETGFNSQISVASKIEKALHLYDKGYFYKEQIYPDSWKLAGSKNKKGNFFATNFILIEMGIFFLFVILWWSNLKETYMLFIPFKH